METQTSFDSRYETTVLLDEYLLFHYGKEDDLLPFSFGPKEALHFPVRCVTECVNKKKLPPNAAALDLGCAVGRSTFELAKICKQVLGIDHSHQFIEVAKDLQNLGSVQYTIQEEAGHTALRYAERPKGVDPKRIDFLCMDAMEWVLKKQAYDVVLVANLICRLQEPENFLKNLYQVVASKGQLIITSPYSWLEEFTPKNRWLKGSSGLEGLKKALSPHFQLVKTIEMPFLIREHKRKYQWSVAESSIWERI